MAGGLGDDLMVGDYGVFVSPVIESLPTTDAEERELENDIKHLLDDVQKWLDDEYHRHHQDGIDTLHHRERGDHQRYIARGGTQAQVSIETGSDIMNGDAGADLIMGDSVSIYVPFIHEDQENEYETSGVTIEPTPPPS